MTNLDSILKSRDISLPTKVPLVKTTVSPVVMYRCESWTINKVVRWRIDAFELWCWRLLRVPWTARRSNQSILKEISPEYPLEGLMLTEAPILWPPDAKNRLIGKDPDAGKDWRQEEEGTTEDEMVGWHPWLNEYEFAQALGVGDGQGSLAAVHGISKSWTQQSNWSELTDVSFPLRWKSPKEIYTSVLPEVHQILSESFTVVCDSSLMPMANSGFSSGLGALSFPDC